MELKRLPESTEETILTTTHLKLDEFINSNFTLKNKFEASTDLGVPSGGYLRFDVKNDDPESTRENEEFKELEIEYNIDDITRFEARELFTTDLLLNILCREGKLDPGIYYIDFSF